MALVAMEESAAMTDDRSSPRASARPRFLTCSSGGESGEHEMPLDVVARARAVVAAEHCPIAPCPSASRRSESEDCAATAYRAALLAMPAGEWSVRRFAAAIERSPRMHIDYSSGARSIPVDAVLLLPSAARVRFFAVIARSMARHERVELVRQILESLDSDDAETARVA